MLKSLLKLLAGLVALLVILAVAGIVAFKLLADPERLKAQVIELVAEQTGRELRIDGELQLSFVPWLGFEVGEVSINNAQGFGDSPFATLDSAEARVRLWPLFRKQIEVGTLAVNGLMLDLVKARSGASNWDDFVPESEQAEPTADEGGFSASGIGAIRVTDASIRYRDQGQGSDYRLSNATIIAGPLTPGKPFEAELAFEAAVGDALLAEVDGRAMVATDAARGTVQARDVEVEARLRGETLGDKPVPVSLRVAVLDFDNRSGDARLEDAVLRALGVTVRTSLAGSQVTESPVFEGPLTVERFSPRAVLADLGISSPETADAGVLKKAAFRADLKAAGDRIDLGGLSAELDDSAIEGRLSLTSLKRKSVAFELNVDQIDLDRYLPPPANGEAAGGTGDEAPLPIDLIRNLNASGTIRVGELKAAGIRSSNVRATIKAANGDVRVNPSQATLYGGSYSGDIRLTARGEALGISMNEQVSGIKAEAMLADLFDTSRVSGAADATVRLNGSGRTLVDIRRSLSGDLAFQFADGYVEGIDLWYEIQRAKALFGKASPPQRSGPPRTRYSDMRGSATVNQGVVSNNDFAAELPFLRLSGAGTVNLAESAVDYRLNAVVLKKPEVEADSQTADLVGARIPVRISGNLTSPTVAPDIGALARAKAEDVVKEKVLDKLFGKKDQAEESAAPAEENAPEEGEEKSTEEALKEELEDKVKDKLKDIFGKGGG